MKTFNPGLIFLRFSTFRTQSTPDFPLSLVQTEDVASELERVVATRGHILLLILLKMHSERKNLAAASNVLPDA
jgi:hypothetical protein